MPESRLRNDATRGWSRRAVLLAGGLLVAGCGGPRRPTIQSEDYDSGSGLAKKLRKILERRAAALKNGDEKGYLAALDMSNDELIRYEKRVFANLRQFELADVRYITESMFEQPKDGEVTAGPIVRVLKLTADAGPGDIAPGESFVYRVREDGDKVVVTDIIPVTMENREELGVTTSLADAPWHTDELTVVQVGKKVWLVGDESVTDLKRYADVAEQELRLVERLWGDRLTYPGHVLFFTRDRDNFKEWFSTGYSDNFNPRNQGYQVRLRGVQKNGLEYQNEYAASRIVVNLLDQQHSSPRFTIRHELTHAVTARATMTDYGDWGPPIWAIEGFARYAETVGAPTRAAEIRAQVAAGVRAGRFRGAPPSRKDFYGEDIHFNYALGSSVFSLAERLKGRDAAVELYARIIERPDSGSFFDLPIFDGMCKDILGISADAFKRRWAGFVRNGA